MSELNHEVEKLREDIQQIKDNIKRVKHEDAQIQTGNEQTIAELKVKQPKQLSYTTKAGRIKIRKKTIDHTTIIHI